MTNYKPDIKTGNTEQLAAMLYELASKRFSAVGFYRIEEFPKTELLRYSAVLVGTYRWGSGEIPREMHGLFEAFENLGRKELVIGVFGTGDSFFPEFCGAVDRFRNMLFVHTDLAATLKVELMPQDKDYERCEKLMTSIVTRLT